MVLSETIIYASLFALTIVFTVFAITIQEGFWRITLKMVASLFWFILAVEQFFFLGLDSPLIVLSLVYVIFGLILVTAIIHDELQVKKNHVWKFEDD